MKEKRSATKKLVVIAMFGALSGILMNIQFPLPFLPPFLKFDLGELPALLGAFLMGPVAGCLIIAIKIMIKLFLSGSDTLLVGELANLIGSLSYVLPAAWIYRRFTTKKGAVAAIAAGTVFTCLSSLFGNAYLMLPMYAQVLGLQTGDLIAMCQAVNPFVTSYWGVLLIGIVPFNLVKYGATSGITFVLYKRVSRLFKNLDIDMLPEREKTGKTQAE
jgi:riboflavin transporter FmnP